MAVLYYPDPAEPEPAPVPDRLHSEPVTGNPLG
jgi:hypothetical protein